MTDKELHKLKRSEMLDLMYYMREEIDALRIENAKLNERIDELIKVRSAPLQPELEAKKEVVVGRFLTKFFERHPNLKL